MGLLLVKSKSHDDEYYCFYCTGYNPSGLSVGRVAKNKQINHTNNPDEWSYDYGEIIKIIDSEQRVLYQKED